MTAALEGVSGQQHALAALYPLYRRLGGPQGRSGRSENLVPTGIRSRSVQPVVSRQRPSNVAKERDSTWRVKTNDELDELIRHKNIINHTKAQRLSWFDHLHRMPEQRMVKKKVYKWKPMSIQLQGRPKNRWEDDIRNDTKKPKIENWISCIQVRNRWKSYAEKAKTFKD